MTVSQQPETPAPSRRALLAGALGGLGAWAASAIGRASPARAADGNPVVVGGEYTSSSPTKFTNATNSQVVLWGVSTSGIGVAGDSISLIGVSGHSNSHAGVFGHSASNIGVSARSLGTQPAALGQSAGNSTGVLGVSSSGEAPAAPAKTGVFGYAAQDAASVGVRGESPAGFGIYGKTTGSGFAGYFNGKVFLSNVLEIGVMTVPAAPGGGRGRIFIRDSGGGKMQLCVRFHTGTVKVLASE